jgi:hypothetical protein
MCVPQPVTVPKPIAGEPVLMRGNNLLDWPGGICMVLFDRRSNYRGQAELSRNSLVGSPASLFGEPAWIGKSAASG